MTLRTKYFPELVADGKWRVEEGEPACSPKQKILRMRDKLPRSVLSHELAHAIISNPNPVGLDTYLQCAEDARVNAWIHGLGVDTDDQVDIGKRAIERLLSSGDWKTACLLCLSLGRAHGTLLLPFMEKYSGTSIPLLVSKLVELTETIMRPDETGPAARCRSNQLADILRLAFNPPVQLDEPEEGTDEEDGESDPDGIPWGKMDIVRLPTPIRAIRDKRYRCRDEGSIPTRFDRLAIDGRVFRNKRRVAFKGTILIDASGSCERNVREIPNLLKKLPAAQIAYYNADEEEAKGALFIAARNGRVANEFPMCGSANLVDGPAIQWLSQQSGKKVLVSDKGFTIPSGGGERGLNAEQRGAMSRRLNDYGISVVDRLESLLEK